MTTNTKVQIGIILAAIASIGAELLGDTGALATTETAAAPAPTEAPKRRGRPPAAAAATEEKPADETPAPTPEPEPTKEGIPLEDLRALIEPIVKDQKGAEVKALIVKHGGTKLADIPAANHAAFAADIEALSY